jgi:hypothetical protein
MAINGVHLINPNTCGFSQQKGGRGGAGNFKRIKPAALNVPNDPKNIERRPAPVSVESPRPYRSLPEGEATNSDPRVSAASREIAAPRIELSDRLVPHEDALIRQHREMQAEQAAIRARRGGAGNIKRSDDDADREYCEYFPISLFYSMTPVLPIPSPPLSPSLLMVVLIPSYFAAIWKLRTTRLWRPWERDRNP